MFHLLEALVGLGHTVSMSYLRPDSHETEEDKLFMERLGKELKIFLHLIETCLIIITEAIISTTTFLLQLLSQ